MGLSIVSRVFQSRTYSVGASAGASAIGSPVNILVDVGIDNATFYNSQGRHHHNQIKIFVIISSTSSRGIDV